jgi:hypothetical protein
MTIDELKAKLRELIGRDPEVGRTPKGEYFVAYFNWGQQNLRALHVSEEAALQELYAALTKPSLPIEG